jgi:rRNA-processing protein FCF1
LSIALSFPNVILVDANFLIAHANPKTTFEDRAKIDYFLESAEKAKAKIIIPMPAIAEYLVGADEAALDTLNALEKKAYILCAPFDRAAAYECALLDRGALGAGDKKDGKIEPWQKIKIDRQIVAIAKANSAKLIITLDTGVQSNAKRVGIPAIDIKSLELPEKAKQRTLPHVPK